ncbi:MAG: holo-[acyl-carrier-protein] synthase [Myxococcales bacterium]|nr:MAG: holo-[acyl-carrier-protein] synthase [Myxococcales bacterium]
MIAGIGTDIVGVEDFERRLRRTAELKNFVFTPQEIAYCEAGRAPSVRFAARFAAKEALMKALGGGWDETASFKEIEIVNDESGKPSFRFHGRVAKRLSKDGTVAHLSLSHTDQYALAFAVVEK